MYLLLCLTSTVVVQQTQGLQNDDDLNERRNIVSCRALEPPSSSSHKIFDAWKSCFNAKRKHEDNNHGCFCCYFALRDHANKGDEEQQKQRARGLCCAE